MKVSLTEESNEKIKRALKGLLDFLKYWSDDFEKKKHY